MTRLLRDLVRRGWAVLLILAGVAFLSAGHLTRHPAGTSVTMILVLMLGGHMIGTFLPLRTIHVLPVTTRDRWGAAVGVMAVVMPVTWPIATLLGLMLPWSPGRLSVEPLVIVTLFTALYSTAALLWLPAFESAGRLEPTAEINLKGSSTKPRLEARGLGRMLVLLSVAIALLIAPLRWSHLVPLHLADFSLPALALFVLVGLLAVGAALWTPPDTTLQPTRGLSADVLGPPDSYLLGQTRLLDRLTGPARVLVPSFLGLTLASLFVMAVASLAAYFLEARSTDLRTAMAETGMLILEPTGTSVSGRTFHKNFAALVVFLGLAIPLAGLHRLLVLMPLSRWARIALPVGAQILNVAGLWLGVIVHHVVVTGQWPTTVRPEFLLLASGLAAFVHALSDRFDWTTHLGDQSGLRRGAVFGGAIGASGILIELWNHFIPVESQLEIVIGLAAVSLVAAIVVRLRTK